MLGSPRGYYIVSIGRLYYMRAWILWPTENFLATRASTADQRMGVRRGCHCSVDSVLRYSNSG